MAAASTPIPADYAQAQRVSSAQIPVIDISGLRDSKRSKRQAVADEIAKACMSVGFFYIAGHGIAQSLIDDTFAANRLFFDQPVSERMRTAATLERWRGYVPAKLEGEGGAIGGAIETFRTMLDLPWNDPDVAMGKPLHLPNRWPDHLPGFQATVAAYQDAMMSLSVQLRGAFALGLGLPERWFEPFYTRPLVQLSLLHYRAPKSQRDEDLELGAGEHRDTGAFTLLMQDSVGGLEIGHLQHEWIAAPPIPDTFVVNIGDVMTRWTNGRYVSTPHRVINRSAEPRYSMPFFANPDYDSVIAPLPACIQPGERACFEPLHFGPYMDDFYRAGMAYLNA